MDLEFQNGHSITIYHDNGSIKELIITLMVLNMDYLPIMEFGLKKTEQNWVNGIRDSISFLEMMVHLIKLKIV